MYCPSCGAPNPGASRFCIGCGKPLVAPPEPVPPPAPPPPMALPVLAAPRFAGFWIRTLAAAVDTALLAAAIAVLAALLRPDGCSAWCALLILAPWIYDAGLVASGLQATLGKRLLGLRVSGHDLRPPGFGQATGRHFSKYVSTAILGIGFILAAADSRKRALHDQMAGTFVIHG